MHQKIFRCGGYTLIEVLVAITIFSAMLMLAGVALNQGLRQYQGLLERGLDFWNYAKAVSLDKSFNSAVDYYVYTRSDQWFPYFKGEPQSVSYVSLAPFVGELPVVVWIKTENRSDGKQSLVYHELPVYTKTHEDIERDTVYNDFKKGKSLNVLDGVENVEFRFYAYDFSARKFSWNDRFEGNRKKLLPALVRITYTDHERRRGSLNFRINLNSVAKMHYNEIYLQR